MLARMCHRDDYAVKGHTAADGSWGLGRVSLGFLHGDSQPVFDRTGRFAAVMDGEFFDAAPLRHELSVQGIASSGEGLAHLFLDGYTAQGASFLRRLNGKFAAAIFDADSRQWTLLSDRFGLKPLYFASLPGRFLFASEIKSLLADEMLPRSPSTPGLAAFFSYGHLWGEATLLEAVQTLPAAAILTWDAAAGRLGVSRYWDFSHVPSASYDHEGWLDAIDQAFARSVERQTVGTSHLGLSLSGGLDSRAILSVAASRKVPLTTVSLGVKGSLDHQCARRMAELAGCPHESHVLDPHFLAGFEGHMRHMVRLTDGHYLSQCIVIPTLDVYRRLDIRVLLRGHAGELMHMTKAYNFSLDAEGRTIADEAHLEDWLFRHLQAYMLEAAEGPIFAGVSRQETSHLARESLRLGLAETAGLNPVLNRLWALFISQRMRRETALSMVEFGSVAETRLPYLDNDLVDLLLAAPPDLKLDDRIQERILARRFPAFLSVVNANTGTRLGAGPLARRLAWFRLKVLSKFRVPGYQPYERLGLWLRRELAPLVRDLLQSPRCLDRGIYHPDTVRRVVREHLEHKKNHTFLILALMIHELAQREILDVGSTPAKSTPLVAVPAARG
jgi:asparagine synthase (glutamine-hydrolysing)